MTKQNIEQQNQTENTRKINWVELAKHNRHDDCWLAIDGIVYDVTKWAATHPGGDMILLGGGTDASIMAHSIVQGSDEKIKEEESFYDNLAEDEFYNTLRQRVVEYFKQNKLSRRGNGVPMMYAKTLFILANFFLGLYVMSVYGSYFGAFWAGLFAAEIGINIMHDGSHGSFSTNNFLNTLACWTMDMIGASSYVWETQHVGGHHLWTNLEHEKTYNSEIDPDVFSSYPFIRMHPHNDRKWFHAYQHVYGPFIFMAFTMMKVLYNDYACFYYNQVMHISMNQRLSSKKNLIRITISKIASLIYMLIIPMYLNGAVKGFCLFSVAHFTCGIVLAFMFIVTHVSEGCNMLEKGKEIKQIDLQVKTINEARKRYGITKSKKASEHSWAALQCKTSVNWSLDSVFWTNFSGGLNHQIEHHLFPSICHMHYPQLQQIIEKTCAEYEVPYVKYEDIYSAIKGMVNYLRILGNPPQKQKQN